MGQGDWLTTRESTRDKKKRNGEKAKEKKMWVHHVCIWECRRKLRHPRRFFEIWCTCHQIDLAVRYVVFGARVQVADVSDAFYALSYTRSFLQPIVHASCIAYKIASKYLGIRAFRKMISRSCICGSSTKMKKQIIFLTPVSEAAFNKIDIAKLLCKLLG